MKRIYCFLLAMSLMLGAMAQEHLTFKGVPINGTLKSYTDAMVKAGFHYEGTQDGISMLSGDFAGYKDCVILVSTLDNCDVVSRIAVIFPEKETWTSVLGDYEQLKTMLTEKYGTPSESRERFDDHVGGSNISYLYALHQDRYVWYTLFSTELGDIELSIVPGAKYDEACVRLVYQDKKNHEKVRQSAMDDL